jgi:hypothetical protein
MRKPDFPFELICIDAGGRRPANIPQENLSEAFGHFGGSYLSPNKPATLAGASEPNTVNDNTSREARLVGALVRCANGTDAWIVRPLYLIES